jgi:hypothetical protein
VTRRHQKIKRTLVDEAGGRCAVCGYDHCIINLHFHHADPSKKRFGINLGHGRSLAAYRAEAQKCVLVCANCHGEIETGMIPCPPLRPVVRHNEAVAQLPVARGAGEVAYAASPSTGARLQNPPGSVARSRRHAPARLARGPSTS